MTGTGARLNRASRLRHPRDFRRIGSQGSRRASRYFILLVVIREGTPEAAGARLGITVSRKVGDAVVRNRVKRRVREWFRRERGHLEERADLVVIARPPAAELPGREIARDLQELAAAAKLVSVPKEAQ